ncbi:hypothetical protein EVAR_6147_1 [Eumeta japonica]|uniref:Uncharacterized protein n=1 Tax=Eumeta variegata TaxID=151549 RepID=A0A4C1THR9_EUMVA|nr:hypothetical protein EVAR_6147_1 [Eumeta japonica]
MKTIALGNPQRHAMAQRGEPSCVYLELKRKKKLWELITLQCDDEIWHSELFTTPLSSHNLPQSIFQVALKPGAVWELLTLIVHNAGKLSGSDRSLNSLINSHMRRIRTHGFLVRK